MNVISSITPFFAVAGNINDQERLEELARYGANEVFVGFDSENYGNGRGLRHTHDLKNLRAYIKRAKSVGIRTSILLNSGSTDNLEFTKEGAKELLRIISFINHEDVDNVVLGNPFLTPLFKSQCPNVKVKISSHYNCDSLAKFDFLLGNIRADMVIVSQFANKNFGLLRKVVEKYNPSRLEIMCTVPCISGCPYRTWHSISISHNSLTPVPRKCDFPCHIDISTRPSSALMTTFVRREDLVYYQKLGINTFKIGERPADFTKNLDCLRYFRGELGQEGLIGLFSTWMRNVGIKNINLEKLDGFYSKFTSEKCDGTKYNCSDCDHCMNYATNAIQLMNGVSIAKHQEPNSHRSHKSFGDAWVESILALAHKG